MDVQARIADEFEAQLAIWERELRDDPERELLEICLLALEREQIVSVAFHERLFRKRLAELDLPEAFERLIAHALIWAWKDEEMHALYIRSVLLRRAGLLTRGRALSQQLAGAIGGWAAATAQHYRWSDAPLARAVAWGVTLAGQVAMKVPREVARELRYQSFRDFCLFNIGAERTAAMAWQRLVEVTRRIDDEGAAELREHAARMCLDEENHARVFEAFVAALTEDDAPRPGFEVAELAEAIAAVSPDFLPPDMRPRPTRGAVGAGGEVHVHQGAPGEDALAAFEAFLTRAGLPELVAERRREGGPLTAAIKVSFIMGSHRRDPSPIVSPALLRRLAQVLRGLGVERCKVIEAGNVYERFFDNRDVHAVGRYFGFEAPEYELVEVGAELAPHRFGRGLGESVICESWRDADLRISFARLRSHPIDQAYLSLGNLEGLGVHRDDALFFDRAMDRHTPALSLLAEMPPDLTLLDGYGSCADGLAGVMGGRRRLHPRRFYAGRDPISVDIVAGRHLGADLRRGSPTLRTAIHWFGDPSPAIRVRGCDTPLRGWRGPRSNPGWALLSHLSYPVYQLGSMRGSLFVPRMDERAFPPKARPSLLTRAGRLATRALLGLP